MRRVNKTGSVMMIALTLAAGVAADIPSKDLAEASGAGLASHGFSEELQPLIVETVDSDRQFGALFFKAEK